MRKKIILLESQYDMLNGYLIERSDYQALVTRIVEDLNKNYRKAIENYMDAMSGDLRQRKVFEIIATEEIIDPLNLSKYLEKKYLVGEEFIHQLLEDWCDGKINGGLLSRNVSTNE